MPSPQPIEKQQESVSMPVPLPPPVLPVETFFLLRSAAAGTPQNAGLSAIVRTTRTGSEAHFGPFPVSLRPLSPPQPNHGHFGTDVGSSVIQWLMVRPKGSGFAKPPLRRSEQGSNCPVQCVCFRTASGRQGRRCPLSRCFDGSSPSAADATICWPEGRELTQRCRKWTSSEQCGADGSYQQRGGREQIGGLRNCPSGSA